MRRLKRTHQKYLKEQIKKSKRFRHKALAAGAAAAITLGAGLTVNKVLAEVPDPHLLAVAGDTDTDYLADAEELAIGSDPCDPDQNSNLVADGIETATRCASVISSLPEQSEAKPGEIYKVEHMAYGLEYCDICAVEVNMGFIEIVNPNKELTCSVNFIAQHYMEHGSFSYAGTEHDGRIDVPLLFKTLELALPFDPNAHQLPVADDSDEDLLSNKEESAIGYKPFNSDQNQNGIADGIELAKRTAEVVEQLPSYPLLDIPAEPNETYKIEHALDGLEQCHICGEWIHMGGWEIINPKLNLRYPDPCDPMENMFLPDLALHYMRHGSFSCAGSEHTVRVNIPLLNRVLELRFPYEPDDHQLPLDYEVEGVGQLAPDANDLDGDLMADTEELAAGFHLYDADQDENLLPDGIELAEQCSRAIDELPVYDPYSGDPAPNEPYKINNFMYGLERCEICGGLVNMGYWQVINPKLRLSMDVYDISCHYMSHGSFSYSGTDMEPPHEPFHYGRMRIAELLGILEMPQNCGDLGTLHLPGDYNKDCKEDFKDFVDFADRWLGTTDPNENGTDE